MLDPSTSTLASPRLLGAALAGLLVLASCSDHDAPPDPAIAGAAGSAEQPGEGGTSAGASPSEGGAGGAGEQAGAGGVPEAGGGGTAGTSDAGAPAAGGGAAGQPSLAGAPSEGGAGGAATEPPPHITSSQNVGVMTVEQFTTLCDSRGGTVEVMPHCGGFATAKGVSYDSTTQLLSEHTCHGANTCAGWNCAITE